ncbi:lipopolysaccharide assembly protein LapB [Endozoicomonas sp. SCSIO W0465]|uniref:tetratricopeptide repeat protein n=1 Tax=Endozoicomonas sp. SCSIO W0465 TaxID=2918516 RepID=UPI0020756138|nr:CDC27 family protein [Endozoicomonas sp. SCSIO W0465]USE37838.1 CDC27 family protein [Endozoicomonas sp. SCSIO W0465]
MSGSPGAAVRPVTSVGTRGLRQNPARGSYQSAVTRAVKTTENNTEALLSQGFGLLRKRQWDSAVKVFKAIKPATQIQNESKVNGLARALYHQPGKAAEALDLLNQLSAPIQTNTLMTKSRILEALQRYQEAEDLLMQIVKKEAGDPEKGRACKYHDANITLARLWQVMGKLDQSEHLLIATFRQESVKADDLEAGRACKHYETNLGLARLWEIMGKPDKAERLLIATLRQESVKVGTWTAGW